MTLVLCAVGFTIPNVPAIAAVFSMEAPEPVYYGVSALLCSLHINRVCVSSCSCSSRCTSYSRTSSSERSFATFVFGCKRCRSRVSSTFGVTTHGTIHGRWFKVLYYHHASAVSPPRIQVASCACLLLLHPFFAHFMAYDVVVASRSYVSFTCIN